MDLAGRDFAVADPAKLQAGGSLLFAGLIALTAAAGLLVFGITQNDPARECGLAADVARQVGGGPFYRNLTDEMIGSDSSDRPWMTKCSAIFQRAGVEIFPVSAGYPDWVGTRFRRPTFQDVDHATIVMSRLSPQGGQAETLRVEQRSGRWVVTAHHGYGQPWRRW
jgi:hypothetical protein